MKEKIVILLVILGAFLSISYANAIERTPPGSFLKYRATTVGQLNTQISSDSSVRARYAKHYKISSESVKNKISNLSLITLKKPVRVTSYYVGKSGKINGKKKLLPSGTMVFADKTGRPVLAWSCGNPLSAPAPIKVTKKPIETVASPVETPTKVAGTEEIMSAPPIASPLPADIVAVPDSLAMPPTVGAVAVPSVTAPVSGIEGLVSGLGVLGGLVPAVGFVTTIKGDDDPPPTPPVPEPSSMAVLAMAVGLTGIGGAIKRCGKYPRK